MQSISERLKILRGTDSQQKFAESIGLRQTTYGQYERGQSNPDSDTLSAICRTLGVNPRWLILGEEPVYDAVTSQEPPRVQFVEYKSLREMPGEEARAFKKRIKKVRSELGAVPTEEEWEQLPKWAKEHMESLSAHRDLLEKERRDAMGWEDRVAWLEKELAEAKAATATAKDAVIAAQSQVIDAMQRCLDPHLPMAVALDSLMKAAEKDNLPDFLSFLQKWHKDIEYVKKTPPDITDEPETATVQKYVPQGGKVALHDLFPPTQEK